MDDQTRKQIQQLMKTPQWGAIEEYAQDFMQKNFVQGSVKRDTEFNTIWYAAEAEGGKRYIMQFLREMEEEASKVDAS